MLDFQFYLRNSYPEVQAAESNGSQKDLPKEKLGEDFSRYLKAFSQEKSAFSESIPTKFMPQSVPKLPLLNIASYISGPSALGAFEELSVTEPNSSPLLVSQTFFLAILSETPPLLPFASLQSKMDLLPTQENPALNAAEDVFLVVLDNRPEAFGSIFNTVLPRASDEGSAVFPSEGLTLRYSKSSNRPAVSLPGTPVPSFSFSQSALVSFVVAPNVVIVAPSVSEASLQGQTPSLFQLVLHLYDLLREDAQAPTLLEYLTSLKSDSGESLNPGAVSVTTDAAPVANAPAVTAEAAPVGNAPDCYC